jgi:hypothetical protein
MRITCAAGSTNDSTTGGCDGHSSRHAEFAGAAHFSGEQNVKGILLNAGRGNVPGNPLTSDLDIAMRLRELCGAEGYRIAGGQILALRWDVNDNEIIIDRFEIAEVKGS